MKLSMWILADWLKEYSPEIDIKEGGLQIETVRLFSAGFTPSDNCVYIGRMEDLFLQGKKQVICTHKNDILILQTDDIDEITNQVLNAFEFYQSWNNRIQEAVTQESRPADILDIANEVIEEPMYLLDSNQYAIALSSGFGEHDVNEQWDQMLAAGSADMEFLTRLEAVFPGHRTKRGLYYFTVPFIDQNAYNYNMFLGQQWIGLCSMIERTRPLPHAVIDRFHLFCLEIERWFMMISREKESMLIDALFREAISENGEVTPAFVRQYRLRFRKADDPKYFLVLKEAGNQPLLISHVCRELNRIFPDLLAIIYQNDICVIVNCPEKEATFFWEELARVLKRNHYYGGFSKAFQNLQEVPAAFKEAFYAAGQADPDPGFLSGFADHILQYAIDETAANMKGNAIHPDVKMLSEYDKAHGTDFAHTLYIYLEQERSQSKTAQKLNLHRNSLTYRLQRIRQMITADLDDADVRLHLLLSFRLAAAMRQH